MLINLKALIVVLTIAMVVFVIAKPICLRFMAEDDFARRRNTWFALTLTAFISPSFWLFVFVAIYLLALSGYKDTNPAALYVLVMYMIPPTIDSQIPVMGINSLFEMNVTRILAFAVLVPVLWRLMHSPEQKQLRKLATIDILVLAFCGLQLVLLMPYESITASMRRAFLFVVDVLALYFVVSRTCKSRGAMAETMASFCLAGAIYAPLALFESATGWLLYQGIGEYWDHPIPFAYNVREGLLRAMVSMGHPLVLGNVMAIAFGFWLYLGSRVQPKSLSIAIGIWMWIGLLAAYSRGPWLVAVVIFFVYLAFVPNGFAQFVKASVVVAIAAGVVLASPIGERVIDNLPFVGTVDEGSVTYRQRLIEVSWQLIKDNPFFGSPHVLMYMEELRQGQGIIDLINTHVRITLYFGVVGWGLLVGIFFYGMWKAHRLVRSSASSDSDAALLGVNLIACMCGLLLIMAVGGYAERVAFLLAGLAAAYVQRDPVRERASAPLSIKPRTQSLPKLRRS